MSAPLPEQTAAPVTLHGNAATPPLVTVHEKREVEQTTSGWTAMAIGAAFLAVAVAVQVPSLWNYVTGSATRRTRGVIRLLIDIGQVPTGLILGGIALAALAIGLYEVTHPGTKDGES